MQNPVATYANPLSTGANVQDATTYKGKIDGACAVFTRLADAFAAHANSTPDMRVYLDPGHIFTGTGLTEIGADTLGTVTNGSTSVSITGSVIGISGTMLVSGPGIPAGTTATISGSTVTLSAAAAGLITSPQTSAPLRFMQRTAAITAPVSNSRIDRIVVDRITGAVSVITGTPGATPTVPTLTTGVIPVAQVLLTSSTTAISNSMISDERDTTTLGLVGSNQVGIASATTTDLGSTKTSNISVTGTTTITGFGSSASTDQPLYVVTFAASLLLTYNGTSLKLPGAANIKTQAGDNATMLYLGSGNWQCLDYQRTNGQAVAIFAAETSIASASTTDLGSSNGNLINVTGTTTITSLGTSAVTANPIYITRFTGALLLTNSSSLIMPGGANYTTAAGDTFQWKFEGSGVWRCIGYCLASGKALAGGIPAANTVTTLVTTVGTTSSTTGVMGGAALYLTPNDTGQVEVHFEGEFSNNSGGFTLSWQIYYGTATFSGGYSGAPSNGAAITGTAVGRLANPMLYNNGFYPTTGPLTYIITGLTPGQPYWFDFMQKTSSNNGGGGSGTVSIINLYGSAKEVK